MLCDYLKSNSTLTKLSFYSNRLHDSGAKALSECLKSNSTLTKLSLEKNFIGEEGATALSDFLKSNSTLRTTKFMHQVQEY